MFTITPTTIVNPANSFFVHAAESMAELEMSGAVEAFSFNFDTISAKTLSAVLMASTNFQRAIEKYDAEMSSMLNKYIGMTYSANKATMSLLSSDIKKYKADLFVLNKQRKEKGLTPEVQASINAQYQECSDRLEQAHNRLSDMKRYIMMPPETVDALKQVTALSTQGFMILERLFSKYGSKQDEFYKPANLRYHADEDKYYKAMQGLFAEIERGSAIRKQMETLENSITTICRAKIYGKQIDPRSPASTARYELSLVNNASIRYKKYREITAVIKKRAVELHKMLLQIKSGESTKIGFNTIYGELSFLMVFMPHYGQMMSLYLEPKISVIASIA